MTEKKFDLPITRYRDGKAFIGNTIDGKPDGTGWLIHEPKYYWHPLNQFNHNNRTPPTAESSMAENINKTSFTDPKAK